MSDYLQALVERAHGTAQAVRLQARPRFQPALPLELEREVPAARPDVAPVRVPASDPPSAPGPAPDASGRRRTRQPTKPRDADDAAGRADAIAQPAATPTRGRNAEGAPGRNVRPPETRVDPAAVIVERRVEAPPPGEPREAAAQDAGEPESEPLMIAERETPAASPPLPALATSRAAHPLETRAAELAPDPEPRGEVVHVTIGRVEIRAAAPPPPPPAQSRRTTGPTLTLDAYLLERNGRRR